MLDPEPSGVPMVPYNNVPHFSRHLERNCDSCCNHLLGILADEFKVITPLLAPCAQKKHTDLNGAFKNSIPLALVVINCSTKKLATRMQPDDHNSRHHECTRNFEAD